MRYPDFLIIGVMKCGTTTLFRDLELSDRIFMPRDKEPSSLALPRIRTAAGARRYTSLFARATSDQLCGEASTAYTKRPTYEGVPQTCRELLPEHAKFICMLRHPIKRIISHHNHEHTWDRMGPSIDEAVREHPELIAYSSYAMQLQPWLETFGDDRVMVVKFEDYIADRHAQADRLCEFLGVPAVSHLINLDAVHNSADTRSIPAPLATKFRNGPIYQRFVKHLLPYAAVNKMRHLWARPKPPRPAPPTQDTVDYLIEQLQPDIDRLPELLGPTAPTWDLEAAPTSGPAAAATTA
ncbi:MAG: sulfotransferase [Planctomycetota bacterium]